MDTMAHEIREKVRRLRKQLETVGASEADLSILDAELGNFPFFVTIGDQSVGKSTTVNRFIEKELLTTAEAMATKCPTAITCVHTPVTVRTPPSADQTTGGTVHAANAPESGGGPNASGSRPTMPPPQQTPSVRESSTGGGMTRKTREELLADLKIAGTSNLHRQICVDGVDFMLVCTASNPQPELVLTANELNNAIQRYIPRGLEVTDIEVNVQLHRASATAEFCLVDIPGIIVQPDRGQSMDLPDDIKRIASVYGTCPNAMIFAVSDVDPLTSEAAKFARQMDPSGERTIAVFTKVDYSVGRGLATWLFAENDDYDTRYNYHARVGLCNKVHEQENASFAEIQRYEEGWLTRKFPQGGNRHGMRVLRKIALEWQQRMVMHNVVPSLKLALARLRNQWRTRAQQLSEQPTSPAQIVMKYSERFLNEYRRCSVREFATEHEVRTVRATQAETGADGGGGGGGGQDGGNRAGGVNDGSVRPTTPSARAPSPGGESGLVSILDAAGWAINHEAVGDRTTFDEIMRAKKHSGQLTGGRMELMMATFRCVMAAKLDKLKPLVETAFQQMTAQVIRDVDNTTRAIGNGGDMDRKYPPLRAAIRRHARELALAQNGAATHEARRQLMLVEGMVNAHDAYLDSTWTLFKNPDWKWQPNTRLLNDPRPFVSEAEKANAEKYAQLNADDQLFCGQLLLLIRASYNLLSHVLKGLLASIAKKVILDEFTDQFMTKMIHAFEQEHPQNPDAYLGNNWSTAVIRTRLVRCQQLCENMVDELDVIFEQRGPVGTAASRAAGSVGMHGGGSSIPSAFGLSRGGGLGQKRTFDQSFG